MAEKSFGGAQGLKLVGLLAVYKYSPRLEMQEGLDKLKTQ